MIKAIADIEFSIENISDSDDTILLKTILESIKNNYTEINVGHAGTTMRFLSAYLATINGKQYVLTGSNRMKERPIKELVDALKNLGASVEYTEKEGYPPIKITGKKLQAKEITTNASVSSQFISALLLIAPLFKEGLKLKLEGAVVSSSYIQLTIDLMRMFNVTVQWENNLITVSPSKYIIQNSSVLNESDWSAASYFYSIMLLGNFEYLELKGLMQKSSQPDSIVTSIFSKFGITTEFKSTGIILKKSIKQITYFEFDFTDCPDIAQTLAVACAALKIKAKLTGLQTLKIKETDRVHALKTELAKFGVACETTTNSLELISFKTIDKNQSIFVNTYNDHRMAMSFAPMQFLFPNIEFENKEVVSKSFPKFWSEFEKLKT